MGNLLAIKGWAPPTSEVICEQRAHINLYELASISAIAGCLPRTDARARRNSHLGPDRAADPSENLLRFADRARHARKHAQHGTAAPFIRRKFPTTFATDAHAANLHSASRWRAHFQRLGGAREEASREITRKFDSVMFCLSKGLGAPVGSLLLGSRDFIEKAHIDRKMLGGGMRQSGSSSCRRAHRARGIAQTPASRSRKRALPRRRPRENQRHRARSEESGDQHRDLRRPRHRPHRRRNLRRARQTTNSLRLLPTNTPIRMVTHYDVDRAGMIERALAASSKRSAAGSQLSAAAAR